MTPPLWSFSENNPIRYSNPSLSAWGTNFGGMTTKRRVMVWIKGFLAFSWAKSCSSLQTYSAPGIRSVLTVGRLVGWLVLCRPWLCGWCHVPLRAGGLPPSPSLALHQVTPETWGPLLCLSSSTSLPSPSHLSLTSPLTLAVVCTVNVVSPRFACVASTNNKTKEKQQICSNNKTLSSRRSAFIVWRNRR